jgi:hypothetical protein
MKLEDSLAFLNLGASLYKFENKSRTLIRHQRRQLADSRESIIGKELGRTFIEATVPPSAQTLPGK